MTELEDDRVHQALDVVPIVRRGRTFASTQGIFTGLIRHVHTVADDMETAVTPYGAIVGVISPYPDPVPDKFDIWLINAVLRRTSGAGTLSALLTVQFFTQGWGVNDSGAAVASQMDQPLAFWDAIATEDISFGLLAGGQGPIAHIGVRLPRDANTTIRFRSTSSEAATFAVQLVLGLFPVSLGQDAAF